MKLQTERIENHRAQFTIEIETDQLEDAKRKAARKISRQVSIRGFRKGKAPYRLVAQHVGEVAILEEALDSLGDVLYKRALEESDVVTFGPGSLDNFELEPTPTFTFSVPLQPEVDLRDYREVRVDFEEPAVRAEDVEQALRQLQLRAIEVTDDAVKITAAGNRVTIRVESEFIDGEAPEEAVEADLTDSDQDPLTGEDPQEDAAPAPYIPKKGDTFVNDENVVIILDPNEDPFTHGFVENLIDVELGSDVEFELTIPDDDADETIHGRRVWFLVTLEKIEAISIPELDDDFALQVSRNRGDEEMDLAGLRAATREELERAAIAEAKSEYVDDVLRKIVEGAEIEYPEILLQERIDELIREFESGLAQQRIKLEDYYRLTNTSEDDLREQYRERAIDQVLHALVIREVISAQEIEVNADDIELHLDLVTAGYGSGPEIRKIFDTPRVRENMRSELVIDHLNEHLIAIGRGQDPAAAVDALRAQKTADAIRAKARNDRLERYQAEDANAAPAEAMTDDAEMEALSDTAQPGDESASA